MVIKNNEQLNSLVIRYLEIIEKLKKPLSLQSFKEFL